MVTIPWELIPIIVISVIFCVSVGYHMGKGKPD